MRVDFGLGNPNVAGALLAALLPLTWWALGQPRRWLRWVGGGGQIVLLLGVCATASRGALVAVSLVLLMTLLWTRQWQRWGLSLVLLAGFWMAYPHSAQRLAGWNEERGTKTRWEIHQQIPAMCVAAPDGWGVGRSAEAYQNWFQSLEGRLQPLKHLISTHAIILVEHSWVMRWAYLAGWLTLLIIVLTGIQRENVTALASAQVLGILFVTGFFSHVGGSVWYWLGLGAGAVGLLVSGQVGRPKKLGLIGGGGAVLLCVVLWMLGKWNHPATPIQLNDGWVRVGSDLSPAATIHLGLPDRRVVGNYFGRALRQRWQQGLKEESFMVQWVASAKGESIQRLWLTGEPPESLWINSAPTTVVWLNPIGGDSEAMIRRYPQTRWRLIYGALAGITHDTSGKNNAHVVSEKIEGVGLYVTNAADFLIRF